jgi:hypothetical protein
VVVGMVVEGDGAVVGASAEVVGADTEVLGSTIDVPALSLSVPHAITATASVAAPSRRATVLEDRVVPLTPEP